MYVRVTECDNKDGIELKEGRDTDVVTVASLCLISIFEQPTTRS